MSRIKNVYIPLMYRLCEKRYIEKMINKTEAEKRGYIRNEHYESGTSFPEQFIYNSLKQVFPRCINRYHDKGLEFDVYIPELNLRIEYNGEFWHSKVKKHKDELSRDEKKVEYCRKNNLLFIVINERIKYCDFEVITDGSLINYNIYSGISIQKTMNNLIALMEDIFNRFNIHVNKKIDFNRSLYESLEKSCKYRYRVVIDEFNNVTGIEYLKEVYVDYSYISSFSRSGIQVSDRKISLREVNKSGINSYDMHCELANLMFNGTTLQDLGLKTKMQYEKEQKMKKFKEDFIKLKRVNQMLHKKLKEQREIIEKLGGCL